MNTPNPLVPQGSMFEQKAKGKPHLRIAIFIVAIHVVFLGGLLIQGCKKEEPKSAFQPSQPLTVDPYPALETNPPAYTPPVYTPPVGVSTDSFAGTPVQPIGGLPTPGAFPDYQPTPLPSPQPEAGVTEHIVAPRDSFYSLAKKYGVSMKAIAAANPGVDSTRLQVKQKLNIPAPTAKAGAPADGAGVGAEKTYKIKPNDNLSKIAKAHGVTVRELQSANGLKTTHIRAGDTLVIPPPKGKVATAETAGLTTPEPAPLGAPVYTPPPSGFLTPLPGSTFTNR